MSLILNPGKAVNTIGADLGGRPEQSYINCIADPAQFDIKTLTFDSTANISQGEFFVLTNVAGTSYGVWFDIDADGTEPSGAAYAAVDTEIEVDIATGNTAAQVAAAVETALAATADMSFDDTAADGTMLVTQDVTGTVADVTFYDNDSSAYSGGGALASANDQAGVASVLNSTYIPFSAPAGAFYAWFDMESEGSDPSETGTAIEVDLSAASSASIVATALASAINGNANFEAEADGSRVKITCAAEGGVADIAAGDSGFTVSKVSDGYTELLEPGTAVSSLSNNPSA